MMPMALLASTPYSLIFALPHQSLTAEAKEIALLRSEATRGLIMA